MRLAEGHAMTNTSVVARSRDGGLPPVRLHDRDASFTAAFDAVFRVAGARVVRSAVQAPRTNAIRERWIGRCRRELQDRTLIGNQRHLMAPRASTRNSATLTGRAAAPAARRRHQPGLFPRPAA